MSAVIGHEVIPDVNNFRRLDGDKGALVACKVRLALITGRAWMCGGSGGGHGSGGGGGGTLDKNSVQVMNLLPQGRVLLGTGEPRSACGGKKGPKKGDARNE